MYFLGPGDYDLLKALPPGTDAYQLETAPSGHLVLPICEYQNRKEGEGSLTLLSKTISAPVDPPRLPRTVRAHVDPGAPPAFAPGDARY